MSTAEYTKEEMKTALDKIRLAAFRYDRNGPGAVGLDGFEGSYMTPAVFREQLKRVFNIRLSPGELGALMDQLDRDGDGTVS